MMISCLCSFTALRTLAAELVGAKPLHLLTQTALPLKSPTGAFIATLRSANAVAPNAKLKIIFPLIRRKVQRRGPPSAAETGRSCWGSGQQDASAAQGTKRMLGAATRRQGLHALDNPKEEVEAQKS